jgi:serine/threonine-protein phosphatase 4 regulatory subunit 1
VVLYRTLSFVTSLLFLTLLQHCQLIPDVPAQQGIHHPSISVQAFTPILGTLLLSSNPLIGRVTRCAIVRLLARMKTADDVTPLPETTQQDEDEDDWVTGLFGQHERAIFRSEILQQVVIGMGRLDMDTDDHYDNDDLLQRHQQEAVDTALIAASGQEDVGEISSTRSEIQNVKQDDFVNPYFSLLASPFSAFSASQASTPSSSSSSFPPLQPGDVTQAPMTIDEGWVPSAPRPSHRALPHPRDSTPWSSPDLSDSVPLAISAIDSQPDDPASQREHSLLEESHHYGIEEGESDEQAAVGRLSSMSLIAAVAASGQSSISLSLNLVPHLYDRLSWRGDGGFCGRS